MFVKRVGGVTVPVWIKNKQKRTKPSGQIHIHTHTHL